MKTILHCSQEKPLFHYIFGRYKTFTKQDLLMKFFKLLDISDVENSKTNYWN